MTELFDNILIDDAQPVGGTQVVKAWVKAVGSDTAMFRNVKVGDRVVIGKDQFEATALVWECTKTTTVCIIPCEHVLAVVESRVR